MLKEWIIKKLEKDVEPSAGHIELESLSEKDRQQAFNLFSEGDANLKKFLEIAYNNGAPSIFCCSGHGKKPAYVTLKVTDDNIELLRKVGKILSNMNVTTNFMDDHIRGKFVSYHGFNNNSSLWLETAANVMRNPELYDDNNHSIYYHETFYPSHKPFGFDLKKKLLNYFRRKTTSKLECAKAQENSSETRGKAVNKSRTENVREIYKINPNPLSEDKRTDIIYRQIKLQDKGSIDNLFEKLLEDHGSNVGMGYGYPEFIYNNIFSENKSWNAYVASLLNPDGTEAEIIAYIMLQFNKDNGSSFIQGLYVEENYRKRGIAKQLINKAENYSKTMGCKHIDAEMLSYLSSFYYKLGYSKCEKITDHKYRISKNLEKTNNIEGWNK